MTAEELAAFLRELDKHPRIARIVVGELDVTYRDQPGERVEAAAEASDEAPAEGDGEPDELQLPEDVFDPRKLIDKTYAKLREARQVKTS